MVAVRGGLSGALALVFACAVGCSDSPGKPSTVPSASDSSTTASVAVPTTTDPPTTPSSAVATRTSPTAVRTTTSKPTTSKPPVSTAHSTMSAPTGDPSQHNKAGAVAAANAYTRALDHAYASGDVGPLKKLTVPECKACVESNAQFESAEAAGYTWSGGRITILNPELSVETGDQADSLNVQLVVSITDLKTKTPPGKPVLPTSNVVGSGPGGSRIPTDALVGWREGQWKVLRYIFEPPR